MSGFGMNLKKTWFFDKTPLKLLKIFVEKQEPQYLGLSTSVRGVTGDRSYLIFTLN